MNKRDNIEIIEITGAPGSGKTTFIQSRFQGCNVLLGGMPLSYGVFNRVFVSVFLVIYALFYGSLTFRQIWWLLSRAGKYEETVFARINAFRNSMIKFGYGFFKPKEGTLFVDEGISHIPFVLGLKNSEIDAFLDVFRKFLEQMNIMFVETPGIRVLQERITVRGHKRVRKESDVDEFVNKNIGIAEYYKKALVDAGLHITPVSDDAVQ